MVWALLAATDSFSSPFLISFLFSFFFLPVLFLTFFSSHSRLYLSSADKRLPAWIGGLEQGGGMIELLESTARFVEVEELLP
jgi:hypothetical protein